MPASSSNLGKNLLVCGLLLLGVYVVFGQTTRYNFVEFDDPRYVFRNPFVARGLTFRGVLWAFLRTHSFNWHPLTWVSHMLDCQCFGLDAGWHHATNFVLHGVSACVLFLLLRRLSRAFWSSAWVAAVFTVHPLRVESVAWIAERKDVLSGLFFFLALLAYENYVRHGCSVGRYLLVTLLFILGLMAKPMLVTLPLVALLLDYWPLARFRKEESPADDEPGADESPSNRSVFAALLMEKVPWLILSAASCAITIAAQQKAILPFDRFPMTLRVRNALISYVAYLRQAIWPQDLAVYYQHPAQSPSLSAGIGAIVLLTGISLAVVCTRRKCPYLLVGWLWYVGTLVPVIGLLQVGSQARADRYTYLPLIGIFICVAWAVRDFVLHSPRARSAMAAMASIVLAISMTAAWRQTTFWRDNLTLWLRAAACTPENTFTLNNLAVALADAGYRVEAAKKIERAIQIQPDLATAHFNRGKYFAFEGKTKEAIAQIAKAVELAPDWPLYRKELARLLASEHRRREAIGHLERALELDPNDLGVQENLAWALATTDPAEGGDPQRAVVLAEGLCRILPSPRIYELEILAAAYADAGRYTEAVGLTSRALKMAATAGQTEFAKKIESRLKLYEAKKPYRE